MKVSLIIPTYNRGDMIGDAIEQALSQDMDDYEVIVVDQTTDYPPDVQARLDAFKNRIRYIQLAQPNVSTARNAGVQAARGNVVIFIDDDVRVPKNYVSSILPHFADETIGIVVPLAVPSDNLDLQQVLKGAGVMFNGGLPVAADSVTQIRWAGTCSAAYSRDALIKAGLYDEYLSSFCEDVDMSARLRGLGYRAVMDTRIHVTHLVTTKGGCEDRNPSFIPQREIIRLRLASYYLIKDRHILGIREFWGGLAVAYRGYLINFEAWKKGPIVVLRRCWSAISALVAAGMAVRRRGSTL
jgi:glycosyltransferase involved in cell wall biosynthesis